jgi:hypothetical protein
MVVKAVAPGFRSGREYKYTISRFLQLEINSKLFRSSLNKSNHALLWDNLWYNLRCAKENMIYFKVVYCILA